MYSTPPTIDPSSITLPYGVIGVDNRVQVNANGAPYSYIGDLYLKWDKDGDGVIDDKATESGTGFMVGPNVMVTAAHVVYWKGAGTNGEDLWAQEVHFVSKRNDETNFEEDVYGTEIIISINYINGNTTGSFDWAVVTLNSNVGDRTGWFDVAVTTDSLDNSYLFVSGYPDDSDKKFSQWVHSGVVTETQASKFYYEIDASGGQSGSPVFDVYGTVWGIHIAGTGANGVNISNVAYRFAPSVHSFIQEKLAEGLERYPRP